MSSLAKGLKAAAKKPIQATAARADVPQQATASAQSKTVLIGAHFSPQVKAALRMVQANPANCEKKSRDLLGEAINDLCAKYGVPEPFTFGD